MQEGASRFPVCHLLPIELEKIQQNYEWEASQFTSFIFMNRVPSRSWRDVSTEGSFTNPLRYS